MTNIEIIHYLKEFVTAERYSLFNEVLNNRTRYVSLFIENVYQSHNASAIVRTAEALGIQNMTIFERKNSFSPNEEISMGAQKWMNIEKYNEKQSSVKSVIEDYKEKGYRIIATALHENSISLNDLNIEKGKMMFLFGTEKEGLTDEIKTHADEFVKIPMYGFTESFNVSVSVAITLNLIMNKLRQSDIQFLLPAEEKEKLMMEWLLKSIPMGEKILERFLSSR